MYGRVGWSLWHLGPSSDTACWCVGLECHGSSVGPCGRGRCSWYTRRWRSRSRYSRRCICRRSWESEGPFQIFIYTSFYWLFSTRLTQWEWVLLDTRPILLHSYCAIIIVLYWGDISECLRCHGRLVEPSSRTENSEGGFRDNDVQRDIFIVLYCSTYTHYTFTDIHLKMSYHGSPLLHYHYKYSISQKWVHPSHFCKHLGVYSLLLPEV